MPCLLEELEKILNETNQMKQILNLMCELIWNLLKPPGIENKGTFKIDKKEVATQQICEDTNVSTKLEESLENVTKLIALGKCIRETLAKPEKFSTTKHVANNSNKTIPIVKKHEKTTQLSSSKVQNKKKSLNVDIINKDKELQEDLSVKTDFPTDTKTNAQKLKKVTQKEDSSGITDFDIKGQVMSSNTTLNKYSHFCSNSISSFVKTLKMPEDLRCLLKQYYSYESIKLKNSLVNQTLNTGTSFKDKFLNVVKLKLNNDMKTNMKQTERYLKYLEVAQSSTSKSGRLSCRVEYSNLSDLYSHEEEYHRALELKIKIKLLTIAINSVLI